MTERLFPNLLLVGPDVETASLLRRTLAECREPVYDIPSGSLELLPASGTIVLRDVDLLDRFQQQALFAWLTEHGDRLQVVTVARESIFALVEDGTLLDALYYRLNIVTLTPGEPEDPLPGATRRLAPPGAERCRAQAEAAASRLRPGSSCSGARA